MTSLLLSRSGGPAEVRRRFRAARTLLQFPLALSLMAACAGERRDPADDLLASFSRDSTLVSTRQRSVTQQALTRLLDRLGVPAGEVAASDTGCALGGVEALLPPGSRPEVPPPEQWVTCRLRDGAPPVDLRVRSDSTGWLEGIEVHRSPHGAAAAMQELELEGSEEPLRSWTPYLAAVDLDADGTRELLLLVYAGVTGNRGYRVWRYDPERARFALDSALAIASNPTPFPGRPCVRQWSVGGMAGGIHSDQVSCRLHGRWVVVWSEEQGYDRDHDAYVRRMEVRHQGALRQVRVDTIPLRR